MVKGISEFQNLLVEFENKGVVVVTAGLAIVELLRTTICCIVKMRIGYRSHNSASHGGKIFQKVGPHRKAQQQVMVVNTIAEVMSMKARNKKEWSIKVERLLYKQTKMILARILVVQGG